MQAIKDAAMRLGRLSLLLGLTAAAALAAVPAGAQWLDQPRFGSMRPLPPQWIVDELEDRGFTPLARPRRVGATYVVEAESPRGARLRLVIDAYEGDIIARSRLDEPRLAERAPAEARRPPVGRVFPPPLEEEYRGPWGERLLPPRDVGPSRGRSADTGASGWETEVRRALRGSGEAGRPAAARPALPEAGGDAAKPRHRQATRGEAPRAGAPGQTRSRSLGKAEPKTAPPAPRPAAAPPSPGAAPAAAPSVAAVPVEPAAPVPPRAAPEVAPPAPAVGAAERPPSGANIRVIEGVTPVIPREAPKPKGEDSLGVPPPEPPAPPALN